MGRFSCTCVLTRVEKRDTLRSHLTLNTRVQASCNVWLIVDQIYGLHARHLVYSSVERDGDDDSGDDQLIPDSQAKV